MNERDTNGKQDKLYIQPVSFAEACQFVEDYHRHNAPLRAKDGYWTLNEHRLSTPTEPDVFDLLGLPYIEPDDRELSVYAQYLHRAVRLGRTYTLAAAPPDDRPAQQMGLW